MPCFCNAGSEGGESHSVPVVETCTDSAADGATDADGETYSAYVDYTCKDAAIDLATVTSPHNSDSSTVGGNDSCATSRGGHGNEQTFYSVLEPKDGTISIWMSDNDYDSRHETRWGGACPDENIVQCTVRKFTDDPDAQMHTWTNQNTTQIV